MPDAVIVSAVRTPIGRAFKGSLAQVRPDDLAAVTDFIDEHAVIRQTAPEVTR